MDEQTKKNLQIIWEELANAFWEFDNQLRIADRKLYDSWCAGGQRISAELVSEYPSAEELMEDIAEGKC